MTQTISYRAQFYTADECWDDTSDDFPTAAEAEREASATVGDTRYAVVEKVTVQPLLKLQRSKKLVRTDL